MLGAFLKVGINEFEISIKFCVFFIPIMIFFKKNFFWVIIALFAYFKLYFKCKCEKNCTFSNIFHKVKSYFFANIYHSPCDSYWNSQKSIKLKPPSVHRRPIEIVPRLCLSTLGFYVVINTQSSCFFKHLTISHHCEKSIVSFTMRHSSCLHNLLYFCPPPPWENPGKAE